MGHQGSGMGHQGSGIGHLCSPSTTWPRSPFDTSTEFTLSPSTSLRVNCVEGLRINSVEVFTSTTLSDRIALATAILDRL
jgi:hypothetical protein